MKRLASVQRDIPWLPKPGEGRVYVSDERPPAEVCGSAFGFVFESDRVLLTHLHRRGWDVPGGVIDPGETPEQAAVREVWEETSAKVEIVEPVGFQELELFGPRPTNYRWPFPISVQVYYLCRLVELSPFEPNVESFEREYFAPAEARVFPTMPNHVEVYEEALRRSLARGAGASSNLE
ncbi:MAG TPA: NUDIX domain-containing protein [Actinopolymorphaceae bacterium]|nr:NUDIX domain-containing protein [Actinopolymorphaceae bacterium]